MFTYDSELYNEELKKLLTSVATSSGAFLIPTPTPKLPYSYIVPTGQAIIFNAGVVSQEPLVEIDFHGDGAADAAIQYAQQQPGVEEQDGFRLFRDDELWMLGDALMLLAIRLEQSRYDLIIFPLRGGWKLGQIAVAMTSSAGPFRFVPFSEASSVANDDFFTAELDRVIAPFAKAHFRIAIVDVGESGSGMGKMRTLLEKLRGSQYSPQTWQVDFHMFVPPEYSDNYPNRSKGYGRFWSMVQIYVTDVSLLDDWDNATGLEKHRDVIVTPGGSVRVALPRTVRLPAAVVISAGSSATVMASPSGPHVANTILSRWSTRSAHAMLPRYSKRDAWNRGRGGRESI